MSILATLCILTALSAAPQENQWSVHDMERPLPPRIEGASALNLPAPDDATVLFDGSNLDQWQHGDGSEPRWEMMDGYFQAKGGAGDLQTKVKLRDQHLHLEWRVPESQGKKKGQASGNSGVFLMSKYEVQVLETSITRTYADGMAGALYGQYPPKVNVGAGIGKWNSYDIFFQAPRFSEDKLTSPAWVTVFHNGHVIHEHRVLLGPTVHKRRAKYTPHADQLPLKLQDHGDPVHYRNIWVRPLPSQLDSTKPYFRAFNKGNWNQVAADLSAHVKELSSITPSRDSAHPAGMQIASTYIATRLKAIGYEVRSQTFDAQGKTFRNVIVRVGPEEGPVTVVGAHYDVCDSGPGADDNASGVAALLELASQLKYNPPKSPVELAFYALEEPPHFRTEEMGSAHHAKSLKAAGTKVRGMISLEMLGYYDETEGSQEYPIPAMAELYPSAGNFIALVARPADQAWLRHVSTAMASAMELPLETLAAPREVPGVDFSDHQNFWDLDYPAMMITDTAHLRNPHYHQMSDLPDTLDYEKMAEIVGGLMATLTADNGK